LMLMLMLDKSNPAYIDGCHIW